MSEVLAVEEVGRQMLQATTGEVHWANALRCAWHAAIHGVKELDTIERLNNNKMFSEIWALDSSSVLPGTLSFDYTEFIPIHPLGLNLGKYINIY